MKLLLKQFGVSIFTDDILYITMYSEYPAPWNGIQSGSWNLRNSNCLSFLITDAFKGTIQNGRISVIICYRSLLALL